MIYGYIRVSTDKQTVENQRFEIQRYCRNNKMDIDDWIEETISGTTNVFDRKLGDLLKKLKYGDILICSELSRLGRNVMMIMSLLNECMSNGIKVWTIKEGYRLGDDINSKVLAFAFSLSAEIERTLISQRTKEALARKRAEGVRLGRPTGFKTNHERLVRNERKIKELLIKKVTYKEIALVIDVNRKELLRFVRAMNFEDMKPINDSIIVKINQKIKIIKVRK
ncbi:MAG: master DNA invertase Mpi family serine-type recombinase [Culturomica sp.]|jgi:DNA invertase Pin-like site-specific DNA recombinase|nr:master DNA invertase Mpi family serine-type recombinase [Culturomica sp.]